MSKSMGKQWVPLVLGLSIVASAAAYGVQRWQHRQSFVSTDDAQVGGVIIPIRARVSGLVERVPVEDNQAVPAGAELVQRMAQAGSATLPDVEEAQARVDHARALWLAARSDRELQLASLRLAAGPEFSPSTALHADAELQPLQPNSIEQWVDAARQDKLELRTALLLSRQASREIDKQRAAAMPTIQLYGLHGHLSQHGGIIFGMPVPSNRVTQTSVGLQLTLPLATGGAIDARTRQAVAQRQFSEDLVEEARRQAALSARQTYLGVSMGLERSRAEQRAMASAQATLRSTQAAFEVGKRLNSDVLNAQQLLASAEQRWQQARYDTLLAQLQLKATVGALDDAELARMSRLLLPAGVP